MNYIGLDIGGTSIKGVRTDERGNVLRTDSVATDISALAECAAELVKKLGGGCPVGVGSAGMIDAEKGEIIFAGNLKLKNYPFKEKLEGLTGLPVRVTNDANAAALGEAKFGAGEGYADSLFITLGTGVGGGIIIGGKLFEGFKSAGAEIGHTVIKKGGRQCTCGRRGCLEAYASARALTNATKKAMEDNPGCLMAVEVREVSGRTAFDYAPRDAVARGLVEEYISDLACGIINLSNVFRPQAVILGGGVAGQGEALIRPLQELLDGEIFGGQAYAPVKIVQARLGNLAGALGAAALNMN